MKTRHMILMALSYVIPLLVFQAIAKNTVVNPTPVSESQRVRHVKDLLGAKIAHRMGATHPKLPEVMDDFIYEKVKASLKSARTLETRQIAEAIVAEANRHGFDPIFLIAVIKRESQFNAEARGRHGEIGLMQLKPSTGAWIAKEASLPWWGEDSLLDPVQNIRLGAAYLSYLRNRWPHKGQYVSAYNVGPKKLRHLLAKNKTPKIYLGSVLENYEKLYSEVLIEVQSTGVAVAAK
ncbi:MAG TPA: lytic transglycosylase domain-containing protein [Bdellovibrionales bacterium]|nr:lytic transglycosylase domain-containing protein [Bdellovibrionales bacterium]